MLLKTITTVLMIWVSIQLTSNRFLAKEQLKANGSRVMPEAILLGLAVELTGVLLAIKFIWA